ncbi:EAL domain-containing protein [Zoogloeaceae bacterium G21618-S1]|nr:EAL domain-containing protein [Zoogloeaceae bacterium G21618-S1]
MSSQGFSRRQLTLLLWTLILLGLVTSGGIAIYVAKSLASVDDERASIRKTHEQMQLSLEYIRRLAGESSNAHDILLAPLGSDEPTPDNPALDALEVATHDAIAAFGATLSFDALLAQVGQLKQLWTRTTEWHQAYAPIANDIRDERSLDVVREHLNRMQASISSLEGQHKLHLATLLRQWKSSDGPHFIALARQVRTEQTLRWPRALQAAKTELYELAREIELLATQRKHSAIADIKDNQLKPSIDRLTRQLAVLDDRLANTARDPRLDLQPALNALFGEGHRFDPALQSIVVGTGGLVGLQQAYLVLEQARLALIQDASRHQASTHQILDTLTRASAEQIAAASGQAEAALATALRRMTMSAFSLALIFMVLGILISAHIRRQFVHLAELQRENALILNSAGEGVIGLTADGQMRFVNPAAGEMLAARPESMIGQPLDQFWFPDQGAGAPAEALGRSTERIVNRHCRLRRHAAPPMTIEYSALPMYHDQHHAGAVLTFRDISESEATKAALLESEQKFRDLSEKSLVGIYIIQKGLFTYVNPRFADIFGYTRNEIEFRMGPKDVTHPDDIEQVQRNIEKRQSRVIDSIDYQIRCLRKNGDLIHVELLGSATQYAGEPAIIGTLVDTTLRTEAEARVQYQAFHDSLTDLPNRLLCNDRLDHALNTARRLGQSVAVLFLDLDRFKHINDSLGHPVGDALLETVAQRLKHAVRQSDTVGRLGGDEFLILLEAVEDQHTPATVANKIQHALAAPLKLGEQELVVTSSIGISLFPNDGDDAETLIKNADAAMYQAKRGGRSTYAFYSPEFTLTSTQWLSLESALRRALPREEFYLDYQPQVDLNDGHLVGAEALLRWRHPERGLISPAEFIPLAEETGLIIDIGEWVLNEACRQLRSWRDRELNPPRVAINISSVQISRGDLLATVRKALTTHGVSAHQLELEITENCIMEHADKSMPILHALRELGINLAIDDFGTGYSSLAYLRQLPINTLKIDQSFIAGILKDPGHEAIVKAIINLGQLMKLEIVTEGIECIEQHHFVRDNGCHIAQGYLFSRPISPAILETMFSTTCGAPARPDMTGTPQR